MAISQRGQYIIASGLLLMAVGAVGCSEPDGGTLYADLPGPASDKVDPASADTVAANDTVVPNDTPAESPGTDAEAVTSDDEGRPVPAAPAEPDPGAADTGTAEATREKDEGGAATEDSSQQNAAPTVATDDPPSNDPPAGSGSQQVSDSSSERPQTPVAALAGTGPAPTESSDDAGAVDEVEDREIKLLIPQKRFQEEGDSGALRVTYDDIDLLKVLNMEPVPPNAVDYFPDWLKALDGKRIRLRGFMFPTFVAEGIRSFGLARDNGICCFVRQPKIYDMIEVTLADGVTTDYIDNRPFDVEGIFRIDPDADDTELFQLYRIEDAVVLQ